MKRTLIAASAALLLSALPASAASEGDICLHFNSGEKVYLRFDDTPSMSFDAARNVTVKSADKTVKMAAFASLDRVTFAGTTALDAVGAADGAMTVRGGDVALEGFEAGTVVEVFTSGGIRVLHDLVPDDAPYVLSLAGRAPGVYIVTAGAVSLKVAVR